MGIHLDHVSLLVKDLDAAEADWTRILEVLSPGHTMQITRGEGLDEVDGTPMRWLTFQNPDPRGVSIQLWSPAEPGHWPDKVLARRVRTPSGVLLRRLRRHDRPGARGRPAAGDGRGQPP